MTEEIEKAIKLLNDNNYIVVPVSKGQMCLCDGCTLDVAKCRYNSIGHSCQNLQCINKYVKEQINYKEIIANIE
jgi:hypothetical protein